MEIKYVYDQFGQFNSDYIDKLKETLDDDIKSLSTKFATLVVDENFDRYQLERYIKNELEANIIYQVNMQIHKGKIK